MSSTSSPLGATAIVSIVVPGLWPFRAGRFGMAYILACATPVAMAAIAALVAISGVGAHWMPPGWVAVLVLAWVAAWLTVRRGPPVATPPRAISTAAFVVASLGCVWLGTKASESFLQPFRVPSSVGAPTLIEGDHVLVNRLAYVGGATPRRGDLVVFRWPGPRQSDTFNYRVIGVAGDRVMTREGSAYIDGRPLGEAGSEPIEVVDVDCHRKLAMQTWERSPDGLRYPVLHDESTSGRATPEVVVPNGSLFLLADRRGHSNDSAARMELGAGTPFARVEHVVGRIDTIWLSNPTCGPPAWPFARVGGVGR